MQIWLSHQNHFRYGFNGQAFNWRKSPEDKWWVAYGPSEREPGSFWQECLATAKQIRANTSLPLWLLFSGGADSEMALRAFKAANIEIKAAILRFKNDLNIHDISYAVIACEELGVPYQLHDLDVLKFWETRLWDYAEPTLCPSPQLLTTMYLVDQIDGYPILGSGECLLVKKIPADYKPGVSPYLPSPWVLKEREKVASWYRHFMIRNREGCPGFFQYTPEIMLAYLRDPMVRQLTNNLRVGKLSSESSKLSIYQAHTPMMTRPKYTGFEKVQTEDAFYRRKLLERYAHCNQTVETEVSALEKMLSKKTSAKKSLLRLFDANP